MISRFVPLLLAIAFLLPMPVPLLHGQVPRIIGGEETNDFPSVGMVGSQRYGGFCTGALITSTHVLTAAHCAVEIDSRTTGVFQLDDRVYGTSNVFVHPNYNPRTLANDLAILQLSEPVVGVAPSGIYRGTPRVGDLLTIVGFGASGTPAGGSDGTFGTKRVGFTFIDEVTDTLIIWNFDNASENNTAPGDSGGPGFLEIDGEPLIASVTSGGTQADAGLGDMAFNTRVDAFAAWIDQTILASEPDEPEVPSGDEDEGDCGNFLACLVCGDGKPFPFLHQLWSLVWSLLRDLFDAPTGVGLASGQTAEPERQVVTAQHLQSNQQAKVRNQPATESMSPKTKTARPVIRRTRPASAASRGRR